MILKKGMIVKRKSEPNERCWIILEVSKRDIIKGIVDVSFAGLYGFGGLWHGRNPMKHRCFWQIIARGY